MIVKNNRQATTQRAARGKWARQKSGNFLAAPDGRDKLRRNSIKQPIQQYLSFYDDPEEYLENVEIVEIGTIIL